MRTIHPRLRAATLVVPLLCVASAACDIAMADLKEKETAEWRKTYELQPGGRLEIGNVNGKIDVRPGTGNTVEVVAEKIAQGATKEAAREALGRVEITDDASPSLVKVETKLHKGTAGIFGGVNVQVQYSVRVPSNIEVHVSTVNGGIEISGVTGRVLAEATNGGIRGREIAGPIEASTTNGGVDVELTKVAESGVKLETTNGGIKLRLPTDAKASISARIVNGGIDTEGFSIQKTGENSRRRLDGDLNGGGPRIQLEGTNGGISIRPR
jgi:putative adhesin